MTFSCSRSMCMQFPCAWAWIGPMQATNTSQSHLTSLHFTSLHFTSLTMHNGGGGGLFIHTIRVHQHVYNNYITQLSVNTPQLSNKFSCKSIEDILSLTSLFFQKTSLVAFLVFLPYNHATKELLWRKMCKITKPHQKH